jgi:putative Holliday junction resolvase
VGLPVHLDGREGVKAGEARTFGTWLEEITGLPLVYWDERFTTVEAEGHLLAAGLTNKRRKSRRDRVAAQILLQSYLDAGCPGERPIGYRTITNPKEPPRGGMGQPGGSGCRQMELAPCPPPRQQNRRVGGEGLHH